MTTVLKELNGTGLLPAAADDDRIAAERDKGMLVLLFGMLVVFVMGFMHGVYVKVKKINVTDASQGGVTIPRNSAREYR